MAYNYQLIFTKVDKRLSADPSSRLYDLTRTLGCSHPVIENAILENTSLSFREYQKKKLLEKGLTLLKKGRKSREEISVALGYRWPENFSRFVKKNTGLSVTQLKEKSR